MILRGGWWRGEWGHKTVLLCVLNRNSEFGIFMGVCLCLGGDVFSRGRGLEPCKGWLVNKVGRPPSCGWHRMPLGEQEGFVCHPWRWGCSRGPRALRALGCVSSPHSLLRTAGSHGLESSSPPSGSEAELPPTLCTFYLESGCSK